MMRLFVIPILLLYTATIPLLSDAQVHVGQGTLPAQSKVTSGNEKRVSAKGITISESEVFLAMHPDDSNKLVLSYFEADNSTQANGAFPVYYSGDGGITWDRSVLNTDQIFLNDV